MNIEDRLRRARSDALASDRPIDLYDIASQAVTFLKKLRLEEWLQHTCYKSEDDCLPCDCGLDDFSAQLDAYLDGHKEAK